MENPAPAKHPIEDVIARRWSPRAFDERPVESEKLKRLFEAARWAPSSNNEQPWRLLAATKDNRADYDKLFGCLSERNAKWVFRAPVLMLSVASLLFEDDGTANRHALQVLPLRDGKDNSLGLLHHGLRGRMIFFARLCLPVEQLL